ncbi:MULTISPECIES: recombinase family protein [unclassified Falsihalocynthiibacter]|uniref:recombinase family protein n=1 Tax=unclassified Falsihalocynthiibacter TaxID=2854191 RepID=UPI00351029BC
MKRLIAYYRIPAGDQAHHHLKKQEQAVVAWMSFHDKLVGQFVEIETYGERSRPQLARALIKAKEENATLLVAKLGRLDLSPVFLSTLLESQVEVASGDVPSFHQKKLIMLLERARRRSRIISGKTAATLASGRADGKSSRSVKSARPTEARSAERYPSAISGALKNAENANVFAMSVMPSIAELFERGQSLHFIADALNDRKIATARGGRWYPTTVRNILKRNIIVLCRQETSIEPTITEIAAVPPKPWRRKSRGQWAF